ncbi:unnamed protein product [Bemisia tabaci]|uniref:Carboxylesterase type B domain-containing protein n=2 Tax=Bemisia tabaci TaxID=7038 RepID=A0A9P0EYJ9_BEMTA|nr:unnamed protein product [Bemisia tabaci]
MGNKRSDRHTEVDPDFYLNKDMVLVALNYRIGALGFLSTGDLVLPGNWGLKDIIFSLKWLQENISSFGGDKNAVTILGNSKGGAAVQLLLYNEPAVNAGLFRNAFSSDGVLDDVGSVFPIKNMTIPSKRLAELLGCPSEPSRALMKCMQTKPFREIVRNQDRVRLNPGVPPRIVTQWGPVEESPLAEDAAVYPDLDNPSFQPTLPWVQGVSLSSGSSYLSRIFDDRSLMDRLEQNPREILPLLLQLNFKFCQRDIPAVINAIIDYFIGDRPVDRKSERQLARLFTCWYYFMGARQAALRYSGPLWFFENIYNQSVTFNDLSMAGIKEEPTDPDFTLNSQRERMQFPNRTFSRQDLENIDKVIDIIYSFMLYGDPSTGSAIQWDRARLPLQLNYLQMGDVYTQEPDFLPECVKFLENLKTKYPAHGLVEPQNC